MSERLFTVEEAEELLVSIEPLARTIADNRRAVLHLTNDLIALQEDARSDRKVEAATLLNKQTELDFLVRIINESLEAIEEMGAQPKDLDQGLIDFPAILEGEPVLLCWKLGEESIRYYHSYEEGFAGRRPLQRVRS
ncbi:MAG TPA: DUF2203 domain-containing protein [Acidobacteriota bacterium]|nr:DUF2203 domain-containing protein [Acidobacteriota bacterium]